MGHYSASDFPFKGSIGQLIGVSAATKDCILEKHLAALDITAAQWSGQPIGAPPNGDDRDDEVGFLYAEEELFECHPVGCTKQVQWCWEKQRHTRIAT